MCRFYSCVITKDGRVLRAEDSTSHERILKEHNIVDNKLGDREFVRIEITPNNMFGIFSKNREDWTFKIDEEGTLPVWFESNSTKYFLMAWNSWQEYMDMLPLRAGIKDNFLELVKKDIAEHKDSFNYRATCNMNDAKLFAYAFDVSYTFSSSELGRWLPTNYLCGVIYDQDKLEELANKARKGE